MKWYVYNYADITSIIYTRNRLYVDLYWKFHHPATASNINFIFTIKLLFLFVRKALANCTDTQVDETAATATRRATAIICTCYAATQERYTQVSTGRKVFTSKYIAITYANLALTARIIVIYVYKYKRNTCKLVRLITC